MENANHGYNIRYLYKKAFAETVKTKYTCRIQDNRWTGRVKRTGTKIGREFRFVISVITILQIEEAAGTPKKN